MSHIKNNKVVTTAKCRFPLFSNNLILSKYGIIIKHGPHHSVYTSTTEMYNVNYIILYIINIYG